MIDFVVEIIRKKGTKSRVKRCYKSVQTSKTIFWISGPKTHIHLFEFAWTAATSIELWSMNIVHIFFIPTSMKKGMLHKVHGYDLYWVLSRPRNLNCNIYEYWLGGNNQWERDWSSISCLATSLKQCAVEYKIDNGEPLIRPDDHVNNLSRPVGGVCRTETQLSGGCL